MASAPIPDRELKFPEVTARAAKAIERMMDTLPDEMKKERYLPVIGWEVDATDPGFVPGPCIGGEKADAVSADFITESFGVRIAWNLSDDRLEQFQDCALDYLGERFMFVHKDTLPFVGTSDS